MTIDQVTPDMIVFPRNEKGLWDMSEKFPQVSSVEK